MSQLKNKYKAIRKEFKADLTKIIQHNRAFGMMVISTYTASQHRTHIMKVWELLGFNHPEAYKDYCDKLFGKHLTGRDEIMRSIYFVDKELYNKYIYKIPEAYAMGDALAVAYRVMRSK
ncbi:hypothetical protein QNH20_19305 [Neobacillus sp. WH10]|uniref:hypothetical protein n=1 Tax=Neobacillus sp. WH10 TaxID=3047873 RepID=UPI0024C1334F|nr:hypothetical protein [Neobacillus sp. WH10]WHY76253.1 hypothetical protein QNH20_19305 [Neobacillus sp. WH10]